MSGDSPLAHNHDTFDFQDGHSKNLPSTSKENGTPRSDTPRLISASVIVDTSHEPVHLPPETQPLKQDESTQCNQEDVTHKLEDSTNSNHVGHDTPPEKCPENCEETKKLNGDRLDGVWTEKYEDGEKEEDGLCVQCLYYSVQCCECTIM